MSKVTCAVMLCVFAAARMAGAQTNITLNATTCVAPPLNGVWEFGNTCTVVGLALPAGTTLTIPAISGFAVNGAGANAGTINVLGVMSHLGPGTFTNSGALNVDAWMGRFSESHIHNTGTITVGGDFLADPGTSLSNSGHIQVTGTLYTASGLGEFSNTGTMTTTGAIVNHGILENAGFINILATGYLSIEGNSYLHNSGAIDNVGRFETIYSTTSFNTGVITSSSLMIVAGVWRNSGTIRNTASGGLFLVASFFNSGEMQNEASMTVDPVLINAGRVKNTGSLTNTPGLNIVNECGGTVIGPIDGNAPVYVCSAASLLPIVHMSDTTATGFGILAPNIPAQAEYVTPTSQLVGDPIDSISVRLTKRGAPSGVVAIGVMNATGGFTKIFGGVTGPMLAQIPADYEFKLPDADTPYVIQAGDRIGVRYFGTANASNFVAVITDTDASGPFDGANSYLQGFDAATTSWSNTGTTNDMYMTLTQRRAAP